MVEIETEQYRKEIEQWRREREDALRAPEGWLSLAGLFPLQEGTYTLGSADDNLIQLPPSVPSHLGLLNYRQGEATLTVTTGERVQVDGEAVTAAHMLDNADGRAPTLVRLGSVSMNLHRFGDEVALRVRDRANPAVQAFGGCEWYEVQREYRVVGRLVRAAAPTSVEVSTSVKTRAQYVGVGVVEFHLAGHALALLASATSKADELFIIFRDATSGRTTYGAGRYLYAPVETDGRVLLDFNKAYNPPCAFTAYATCTLPPAQNELPVAVEAGERYKLL